MMLLTLYMLNQILTCRVDEHELARIEDYLRGATEYFKFTDKQTNKEYIINKRTYLYMEITKNG